MSCYCIGIMAIVAGLCVLLYRFTKTGRFFIIQSYFYICMVIAGFVASFPGFFINGRSTKNFFYAFPIFDYLIQLLELKHEVRGFEHLETDEPVVVIANHQAGLDVHTLTKAWPQNCSIIIKNSLKYAPIFNWWVYLGDSIFIERFNKEKSRSSLKTCLDKIKNEKRKVYLFPEGTRNTKKELLPFKKGAFIMSKEANIPVVPVVYSRYDHFFNYQERRWEFGGKIIISVLPPVDPAEFADVDALSKECRSRMQNELDQLDKELAQSKPKSQ